MAKVINKGLAGPDDPIYTEGWQIVTPLSAKRRQQEPDPMQPAIDAVEKQGLELAHKAAVAHERAKWDTYEQWERDDMLGLVLGDLAINGNEYPSLLKEWSMYEADVFEVVFEKLIEHGYVETDGCTCWITPQGEQWLQARRDSD